MVEHRFECGTFHFLRQCYTFRRRRLYDMEEQGRTVLFFFGEKSLGVFLP